MISSDASGHAYTRLGHLIEETGNLPGARKVYDYHLERQFAASAHPKDAPPSCDLSRDLLCRKATTSARTRT